MVVVDWVSVIEELGMPFCRCAMEMRVDPFMANAVNPCALYDGENNMFRVILLGPFNATELQEVMFRRQNGEMPFYESRYMHMAVNFH